MSAIFLTDKCCSRCSIVKPAASFYRDERSPGGLRSACIECEITAAVAWQKHHPKRARAINNKATKKYKRNNSDKMRLIGKNWRAANRKRANFLSRKWQKAHPEVIRAILQNRRARLKGAPGKHTAAEVMALYKRQRGKCPICKTSIKKCRHKDHITPLSKGGSNDITNLQLLCGTCNNRKYNKDPVQFMQENGFLI